MSVWAAVTWVLAAGLPGVTSILAAVHWSLKRILRPHVEMHESMARDIRDLKRTDRKIDVRLSRIEDRLKVDR